MNQCLKVFIGLFLLCAVSVYANENDSLQNLREFHLKHAKQDILISGVGFLIGVGLFAFYDYPGASIRDNEKIGFSIAFALPTAFAFNSLIDVIQSKLIMGKINKRNSAQ